MVHRGALTREKLEQPDAFVLPVIVEREPKDALGSVIVRPIAEHESCAAFRRLDAPTRENPGDLDDVLLRVAAVDAEGVQLQQLARVILVDAGRLASPPLLRHFVLPEPRPSEERAEPADGARRRRRRGTGRHTLRIVEIEQHRRTFGRRDQQVLKAAERTRPNGLLDIGRQQETICALADKDVEMIRPEIDHYLI